MTREEAKQELLFAKRNVIADSRIDKAYNIAIKALEQPECEDAVSRKWLIETAEEGWIKFDTEEDYNRYIHLVRDIAPSVTPKQPGWIPCSERMPKPKEYEDDVLKYYLIQNEFGDMMVCSWDGKYWTQMYQYKNIQDKVLAWMPLPKPYREGGQDERSD